MIRTHAEEEPPSLPPHPNTGVEQTTEALLGGVTGSVAGMGNVRRYCFYTPGSNEQSFRSERWHNGFFGVLFFVFRSKKKKKTWKKKSWNLNCFHLNCIHSNHLKCCRGHQWSFPDEESSYGRESARSSIRLNSKNFFDIALFSLGTKSLIPSSHEQGFRVTGCSCDFFNAFFKRKNHLLKKTGFLCPPFTRP